MMDPDRPYRCNSINSNNSISSATTTGELFICFTSRLSSSSTPTMKIPSSSASTKPSIHSPARAARGDPPQISLSSSLSRRLRSNGSMRGGASPMFGGGKKRGCGNGFENAEPSSPKVTCIGQVRVKTKKQGTNRKKIVRARSVNRGGEVSFRRVEQSSNTITTNPNNNNGNSFDGFCGAGSRTVEKDCNFQVQNQQQRCNQRWVHLPLSVCEALREFNCFFPCRSSCVANEKNEEEGVAGRSSHGGCGGGLCGAVFARWLVAAVDEGDGGRKGLAAVGGRTEREDEGIVEDNEEGEGEEEEEGRRSYRRHVFEGIEFKELEKSISCEQEASRVSVCVPPKNALLLMRCRSDPVRMAALANKFLEPTARVKDDECNEVEDYILNLHEEEEGKATARSCLKEGEQSKVVVEQMENVTDDLNTCEKSGPCESDNAVVEEEIIEEEGEVDIMESEEDKERSEANAKDEEMLVEQEEEEATRVDEVKNNCRVSMDSPCSASAPLEEEDEEEEYEDDFLCLRHLFEEQDVTNTPVSEHGEEEEEEDDDSVSVSVQCGAGHGEVGNEDTVGEQEASTEPSSTLLEKSDKAETAGREGQKDSEEEEERVETCERSGHGNPRTMSRETQMGFKSKQRESQQPLLPDCLLLMMCEPKLSMEVSKETWVCSTDFIRWLPDRRPRSKVNKAETSEETKKRISIDFREPPLQRSKTNNSSFQQPPRSSCSYPAQPPQAKGTSGGGSAGGAAGAMIVLTRCKSEPHRPAAKLAPEPCFWKNRKLEPHRPASVGVGAARVN